MLKRRRTTDSPWYFYFAVRGTKQEIPLGKIKHKALQRYEELIKLHGCTSWPVPADIHRQLFVRFSKNAKNRGIEFSLTEEDIKRLIETANGRCEVSGIRFSMQKLDGMRVRPWSPSIDRVNSAFGYHVENCRILCAAVNLSINQWGDDVFYAIAGATVRFNNANKSLLRMKHLETDEA